MEVKMENQTLVRLSNSRKVSDVEGDYYYPTYHDGFVTINKKTDDKIVTVLVSNCCTVRYEE